MQLSLGMKPRTKIPAAKKMVHPAAGGTPSGAGNGRGILAVGVILASLSPAPCLSNLPNPETGDPVAGTQKVQYPLPHATAVRILLYQPQKRGRHMREGMQLSLGMKPRTKIPAAKKMVHPAAGGTPSGAGNGRGILAVGVILASLSPAPCLSNLPNPETGDPVAGTQKVQYPLPHATAVR
ncbi:hypothetical protein DV515_00017644, partial [Chloebia gouldiae]